MKAVTYSEDQNLKAPAWTLKPKAVDPRPYQVHDRPMPRPEFQGHAEAPSLVKASICHDLYSACMC